MTTWVLVGVGALLVAGLDLGVVLGVLLGVVGAVVFGVDLGVLLGVVGAVVFGVDLGVLFGVEGAVLFDGVTEVDALDVLMLGLTELPDFVGLPELLAEPEEVDDADGEVEGEVEGDVVAEDGVTGEDAPELAVELPVSTALDAPAGLGVQAHNSSTKPAAANAAATRRASTRDNPFTAVATCTFVVTPGS